MPLNETQIIALRALLNVHAQSDAGPLGGTLSSTLNNRLQTLSDAESADISDILTQYSAIRYETGILSGDYNDDPERKRSLLRTQLIAVLQINPSDYTNSQPFTIERGS